MLRFGEALRKLFSFGRGILVFAFLFALCIGMRLVPYPVKESIASGALSSIFYPAQSIIASIDDFQGVRVENDSLKKQNARLRMELDHARDGLRELVRLRALVRFDNKWNYPIVTARIIGRNPGRFVTTLILNCGKEEGLQVDMPVFTMKGLVGRISKVSGHHAFVQVLWDPTFKFSTLEMRTRTIGYAEAIEANELAAIIPAESGVRQGDTIVTSGLGGIFPKGIGVGIVSEIIKKKQEVTATMVIEPFQEVSLLEEVFVMQKEPDWVVRELSE